MKCRILLILLLFTISAEIIQSKTFSCNDNDIWNLYQCSISNVTTQDSIFLLPYVNLSFSYPLTYLTILNSTMDDIPSISSNSSIKLNYLDCNGCGLPNITNNSFSQLSNLNTLKISFGSYKKLQENLFSQVPLLRNLNVSHGSIVEIDDNAFSDLANLQFLDLSFNNITTITSNMFSSLKSLYSLSLSYNKIKILDEGLFTNNTNLKVLILDHNRILEIEAGIFNPQNILDIVYLSYNELTALDTANVNSLHVRANNNKLSKLSISSSNVLYLAVYENYIENVVCDEKGSLILLNIANNSLTDLGCIGSLSKLTSLDLSYNNIGKLNHSSFATLTELTMLFLRSTNISKLDYGVFSHQSKLEVFDIAYNHLGNIALEMLLAAKFLRHLFIDGNNVTEFSYIDLRMSFTRLYIIGIGDNDFNCTFLAQAIKGLNNYHIEAVVSSGKKVTHSHNINGIGCKVKDEKTAPSWISSETRNDIDVLNFQIDKITDELTDVSSKIKILMAEETLLHSSQTSESNSHSDNGLLRNVNIILITLIVAFCIYKGYKLMKNDVPRLRGYNTANTPQTDIEMNIAR